MVIENKYIAVNELLETLDGTSADMFGDFDGDYRTESGFSRAALDKIIEAVPRADVREVVYGVWLDAGKNIHGQNLTRCSVCNSNSIEGGLFCRCCGAIMKQ